MERKKILEYIMYIKNDFDKQKNEKQGDYHWISPEEEVCIDYFDLTYESIVNKYNQHKDVTSQDINDLSKALEKYLILKKDMR